MTAPAPASAGPESAGPRDARGPTAARLVSVSSTSAYPSTSTRALHVAARHPPGEGDVGEPAGVALDLDAGAEVEHGAGQRLGYVEQPGDGDLLAAEDGQAGHPDRDREQRAEQLRGAGLGLRRQRGECEDGDMGGVRGGRVVELRRQPGVAQGLPVTAYGVVPGVVGDQLERVQPRHQGSRALRRRGTVVVATASLGSEPRSTGRRPRSRRPRGPGRPSRRGGVVPPGRRGRWCRRGACTVRRPAPPRAARRRSGSASRARSGTSPSSTVRLRRVSSAGTSEPKTSVAARSAAALCTVTWRCLVPW